MISNSEQQARYCPYLGGTTIDEFNLDHIIPEMIGGKRDFGINVSKERNGFLGTHIEPPAFDNLLFRFLRQQCQVKGKSRVPNVSIIGQVKDSGSLRYELIMKPDGTVEHSLRDIKQVQINAVEGTESVTVFAIDGQESTADQILEALEKRGEHLSRAESLDKSPPVNASFEIDAMRIQQAMAKIVFGAACMWLPGYAESDPGADLVRDFIFQEDRVQAVQIPLRGGAFLPADSHSLILLSSVEPCEHRVAIIASGGKLAGLVCLFGDPSWNMIIELSEDLEKYGWAEGQMRVASCVTSSSSTSIIDTTVEEVSDQFVNGGEE